MAYKALYRAYRPQLFREVVGQEAIVKTLQNAIANNKISHAYLFCGPRGTGKTTIARIFAKALNCDNQQMYEPCDHCKSCYEITDSISPDVIEIDAASNNGVEEIRDIREKVKFLPSGAKYKIYIIDEVHMLSTGAFNALLKTLEEPPQHVIFILATTEPQKLPPTIISRCQRFDFKALTVSEISKRIRLVCADEEIEISEEAVNAISEAAEGALRDALSILDQAISYSDDVVTIEDVNVVTGNLSYDKLIELASHFASGDVTKALETINDLIDLGKEVNKIVSGLLQFYRDMLLYQNIDASSLMYYKYIFGKVGFIDLAKSTSPEKIFYYLDILSDVQMKIKYSTTPRIYLEVAVIKMINMSNEELDFKSRLDALENTISNLNQVGSIEIDNDKVNLLELKINKVIDELHKLEIHKIAEKVNNLENQFDDKALRDIHLEIEEIKERLDKLMLSSSNGANMQLSSLIDDVNNLKLLITDIKNQQYDNNINHNEYKDIRNKLNTLEKIVYQIAAGKLSQKEEPTKKVKVCPEQIALFENDLTPIEDIKAKEIKVDFKDLSKKTSNTDSTKDNLVPNETVEENTQDNKEDVDKEKICEQHVQNNEIAYESNVEESLEEAIVQNIQNCEEDDSIEESIEQNVQENKEDLKPNAESTTSNNQELIEEDLFKEEKQLIKQELQSINKKAPQEEEKGDHYQSYDIRIVENILNQAFSHEARADMVRINKLWAELEKDVDPINLGIAEMLKDGNVVAVGNKEFIITYKTAALCNQVMRSSFKNKALVILKNKLGDEYNYIALPEKIWLEKRQEYIDQYTIGIKYPKLKPINDPELVIYSQEYVDPKDQIIDKLKSVFGDDIVNVE